jgi:hypothetical protein
MLSTVRRAFNTYTELPDFGLARLVSDLFSPPVIWGALAFPIALRDAPTRSLALLWAGIYILLVCIVPLIYITVMIKRGKISDIHLANRSERVKPLLVSLASTTLAWWVLRAIGAPSVVPQLALVTLVQMGVLAAITLIWQISMHAMSSGAAVVGSAVLYGPIAAFITVPMLVLVGWARLHLHKHTRAQVIAGAFLGVIIPAFILTGV